MAYATMVSSCSGLPYWRILAFYLEGIHSRIRSMDKLSTFLGLVVLHYVSFHLDPLNVLDQESKIGA